MYGLGQLNCFLNEQKGIQKHVLPCIRVAFSCYTSLPLQRGRVANCFALVATLGQVLAFERKIALAITFSALG